MWNKTMEMSYFRGACGMSKLDGKCNEKAQYVEGLLCLVGDKE